MPEVLTEVQPSTSMLEKCARAIATDVTPGLQEGERGLDPMTIITLIMGVIQAIIQACPKAPKEIRESFKRPTLRQRTFALLEVRKSCECSGRLRDAMAINRSLLARASSLPDPDADALIGECSDQGNLLV